MRQFSFVKDENVLDVRISENRVEEGVWLYRVEAAFADPSKPGRLQISWHEPIRGITQFWSPTAGRGWLLTQWWSPRVNESKMAFGAPVMSLFWQGGGNYRTVALSEAELPTRMLAAANDFEEKDLLDLSVILFENNPPGKGEYTFHIRIDERPVPMEDSVGDVSRWWQTMYPRIGNSSPWGEVPLYSSWYNYHQNPLQESLERELPLAAEAGFRSMIIDDGWSYDGPGSGDYIDCGNWQIALSKFPDFRGFMKKAHDLDIRVALWFPVPFVGWNSPDYEGLKDMLLCDEESFRAGVLDPRYPAVRKYILDSYRTIVEEYDLDGLKLDFIDSFRCDSVEQKPGMDCAAVETGVNLLLQEIDAALRPGRPDFMIEYRQNYVGPSITRYGDMLRVGDCAYDAISNRIGVLCLRTLNYPLAVHSDMYIWPRDEDPAVCARILQNTLFAVPQISVRLQDAPESHRRVIGNFVRYWDSHRDLLLHGKLSAINPEANYSAASAEDDSLRIGALYARNDYIFDGKATDLFNATERDYVFLEAQTACDALCSDCFGGVLWQKTLEKGTHRLDLPGGGMVQLRKNT